MDLRAVGVPILVDNRHQAGCFGRATFGCWSRGFLCRFLSIGRHKEVRIASVSEAALGNGDLLCIIRHRLIIVISSLSRFVIILIAVRGVRCIDRFSFLDEVSYLSLFNLWDPEMMLGALGAALYYWQIDPRSLKRRHRNRQGTRW